MYSKTDYAEMKAYVEGGSPWEGQCKKHSHILIYFAGQVVLQNFYLYLYNYQVKFVTKLKFISMIKINKVTKE